MRKTDALSETQPASYRKNSLSLVVRRDTILSPMKPDHPPRAFLTGPPGCGKTTIVTHFLKLAGTASCAGFYTKELREGGTRVGFDAVGLSGGAIRLAHVAFPTEHRVGKYGVDIDAFEEFFLDELGDRAQHARLIILDEVGKMECLSHSFITRTRELLSSELAFLGTIAQRGGGFIAELKRRADVELLTVDNANRNSLPLSLADRFSQC